MNFFKLHPATRNLLRQQASARIKRTLRGFRSRRRIFLSLLAAILAVMWIGQAIAGIVFREAADPANLMRWIALGLTAFGAWNVIKVIFRKPIEPFEWTAAEREWLGGAPLGREQMARYRIATIAGAAVIKAAIFALVMIPDLTIVLLGFIGMLFGLLLIELVRMAAEIVVYTATRPQLRMLRIAVFVCGVACAVFAGIFAYQLWNTDQYTSVISLAYIKSVLWQLSETQLGMVILFPAHLLAELMLADRISWLLTLKIGFWLYMIRFAILGVVCLDKDCFARRCRLERLQWKMVLAREGQNWADDPKRVKKYSRPPRFNGIGSLAWRQLLGVNRYRGTIAIALAVPFVLACLPVFSGGSGIWMIANVIGGLVFYSFLLLPTTLKFDFRRDLDRINVLKSLPIGPMAVTIGQLLVPFAVTTLFQAAVLGVVMILKPFDPLLAVAALVVLIPINVFIYGLENLIFLLYPYRLNAEGIQVFLRSILTFTAKGLIFGLALAAAFFTVFVSKHLGQIILPANPAEGTLLVFTAILTILTSLVSVAVVVLLSRTYSRLDPSLDLTAGT